MATIYDKNAAYMALPMNIKRGNPIPLDTTAVWDNKSDLEAYAKSGATSYVGQILTLFTDGVAEAYLISNEAGDLVKLAQTSGTGDISTDITNLNKKINSLVSEIGKASTDTEAASGLYALIEAAQKQADKGVANAKTADDKAQSAQNDLDALEAIVGTDDTEGLRKRIKTNETNIATLVGNDAEKSAREIASEEVVKVVAGAPEAYDTLKEISDWISSHGTDAASMNSAIKALQAILAGFGTGEGEVATVKKYVDEAITALKIGDYAKAADLTALAARVDTLEKLPAHDITADDIAKWNAKQDAGDYVEQTVYDTKMTALEKADSDNATAIANVKKTADAAVVANDDIVGGTATKITYDAKGLVTKGESLTIADIPTLGISKIDGLQDALNGKQNNLTFDGKYNSGTNKAATVSTVNTAVDNLIHTLGGEDGKTDIDTKDSNTIHGAKLYADEVGKNTLASAKTYADGLVGDTSAIAGRVSALEGKVDVEKVSTAISTAKTEAITTAGTNADTKVAAAKTAILGEESYEHTVKDAYELAASKTTMKAVEDKGYAVKTEVDTAVANAKKAGTDAQASVNALSDKVGTVPAEKTVVQMIADAQTAATYDDSGIKASIKANTDAITKLNGADTIEGSVAKAVKDAVATEKTRAESKEQENATAIAGVKSKVDAFFDAENVGDAAIDTLKEIQDYISTHGAAADEMVKNIAANKAAIGAEETRAKGEEAKLNTAITEEADRAKDIENGLKGRLDTLEGADTVEGSVAKTVKDAVDALNVSQYAKDADVVKKETGKSLIEDTKIAKLDDIAEGAQVNVIEKIQANGTNLEISNKTVNIPLATAERAGLIVSSDAKDSISISNTGIGVVNSLNINKLYQNDGDELVLDGGASV